MTTNDKDHNGTRLTAVAAVSVSASNQRPHADVIERVARSIFSWRYPQAGWDENLWAGHRDDCLLMAAQFRELFLQGVMIEPVYLWTIPCGQGISPQWRQSFVAGKVAESLAELAAGMEFKGLPAADRAWLRAQADSLVEDALQRFAEPISTAHLYRPQDEPEYDFEGRTAAETEGQ